MATNALTIIQPTDSQIVELFLRLESKLSAAASFAMSGYSSGLMSTDNNIAALVDLDLRLITSATISGTGFTVTYYPRVTYSNNNGGNTSHPYYASIVLNTSEGYGQQVDINRESIAEILIIIGKYLKETNLDAGLFGQEETDTLTPHLALLSKIEASAADQIARTNAFFIDLTARYDEKRHELEKQFAERTNKLEREIEAKQEKFDFETEALEALRKEIDDRNNTHARRAIHEKLLQTLRDRQQTSSVSREGQKLRVPIHGVFILLIVTTLMGAIYSFQVWSSGTSTTWDAVLITSFVKSALFSFGFLTASGLYISWMSKWSEKHVDAEFNLKQFEIDISRASWAVEAALEWKGVQGEHMPNELVTNITKNLFSIDTPDRTEYSPLEALATSILGSASNLKVNVNGSEVSYDRKTLKEIKKTSE